ncbi:hypothetical protein EZS27_025076 [termite gut metagenome]|uniref:O-antigen ligase domain-containing protein n=1 Tax=termite gut metagenome TaxID=433724 RepID=A0A5J4QVA0_9ZZZZ
MSIFRCNSVSFLIISFLLLSPFFDAITGFSILNGKAEEGYLGSPSQILRICFLFFGFFTLTSSLRSIFIIILCYLLILESTIFFWASSIHSFFSGINITTKILFAYLFYAVLSSAIELHKISITKILNIYYISAFLYSVGVIFPFILGIGASSYTEGTFGTKGFFASGNALSPYLGVASSLLLLKKNKSLFMKFIFLFILITLILLGTKASLFFLIINIYIYISIISPIKRRFFLFFVFVLFFYIDWNKIYEMISEMHSIILYRYQNSSNILSFILSGRDIYVRDAFKELMLSNIFYFRLLLGGGALLSFRTQNLENIVLGDTLETDLFDILFMYGFVGVVIYIFIIIKIFYFTFYLRTFSFFVFIAFFIHSIFAGHILFNGMSIVSGIILYIFVKERGKYIENYYHFSWK